MLAHDCMCDHYDKFCLQDNKKNIPRTCQVCFSDKCTHHKADTSGMEKIQTSVTIKDKKGIKEFCGKQIHLKRVVEHSRTLSESWRTNCDIKLLLYFSNPNFPDIGEIEDVCKYVVKYTGKQHQPTQQEMDTM